MEREKTVVGEFNYVGPNHEKAVYFKNQPERNVNFQAQLMPVHDIRIFPVPPSLDQEGFMLAHMPLEAGEQEDAETIAKRLEPAFTRFLSELTGAKKIVLKAPILRWSDRAPNLAQPNMTTSRHVHCDFDKASFQDMARDVIAGDSEADKWLAGRYAVIQLWRALSAPPQDTPLAVIDRRTIGSDDLVRANFVFGQPGAETWHENFAYRYNPAHRWAFVSNMGADDALLFTGYDTANGGTPGTPHTAFDYWRHDASAQPRRSCEVRAFIFWG